MTTTNKDIFRVLKEILVEVSKSRIAIARSPNVIVDNSAMVTSINSLLTELQSLVSKDFATQTTLSSHSTTNDSNLTTIKNKDFATQSTLEALRSQTDSNLTTIKNKDFATQVTLALMKTALDSVKTNTDPEGGTTLGGFLQSSALFAGGILASGANFAGGALIDGAVFAGGALFAGAKSVAGLLAGDDTGPLTTMDTSLNAIEASNATINTSLNAIESDVDQSRISNANIAARITETDSSHTFNWFLDFTVDGGGAGTVIITLVCPTGQKMRGVWMTVHMPVQTQTTETVTIVHTTGGDENKRVVENTTFTNTTKAHHSPRAQTDNTFMDGSSYPLNMSAGEKLVFTFSSLTAADQFHINLGCELRDGTVIAASTKTGTATITVNQEDHEEIA